MILKRLVDLPWYGFKAKPKGQEDPMRCLSLTQTTFCYSHMGVFFGVPCLVWFLQEKPRGVPQKAETPLNRYGPTKGIALLWVSGQVADWTIYRPGIVKPTRLDELFGNFSRRCPGGLGMRPKTSRCIVFVTFEQENPPPGRFFWPSTPDPGRKPKGTNPSWVRSPK